MSAELGDLKLGSLEYGYLVADTHYTASEFKLWIPKLMPLIGGLSMDSKLSVIDNNVFVNEVKPQTASSVSTCGFVTVRKFQNADFEFKVSLPEDPYIKKGTKLMITILHGNINDMYVTDYI